MVVQQRNTILLGCKIHTTTEYERWGVNRFVLII